MHNRKLAAKVTHHTVEKKEIVRDEFTAGWNRWLNVCVRGCRVRKCQAVRFQSGQLVKKGDIFCLRAN